MMEHISRVYRIDRDSKDYHASEVLKREWLVTNGLGGYASGTVAGINKRRYHGLLIAALPGRMGRTVLLNHLSQDMEMPDGKAIKLLVKEWGKEDPGAEELSCLQEFRLESGLPVWRFQVDDCILERRIVMPHLQNSTYLRYSLLSGPPGITLYLRPTLHFRGHEAPVDSPASFPYRVTGEGRHFEISDPLSSYVLRLLLSEEDSIFVLEGGVEYERYYSVEADRGYESSGRHWSPGYFRCRLNPGGSVTLIASAEPWSTVTALAPEAAFKLEELRRNRLIREVPRLVASETATQLVLSADQFLISPVWRVEDLIRSQAIGTLLCSVIAGYHWFTDWGRDTMISLEGLTLVTGRFIEAAGILNSFAVSIHRGLIPNLFPEGRTEGLYHTADATLWFFHTLDRYLKYTDDRALLRRLMPMLKDIIDHHRKGTLFGIGVDPQDGLLRQGQEGYQLTWMDAKVGDWVVTPRRGKAVEINALWYNALCLMSQWLAAEEGERAAAPLTELAGQAGRSFNERFWYAGGGYLYDVVDGERGDDDSFRPNQIFAISLPNPALERQYWSPVLDAVRERLLTPMGLRTLDPNHIDFKEQYFGNLRARDAAYHQGTVWPWLIGHFIDAWLRLHPDDLEPARKMLDGLVGHLDDACIGSISEIFDAIPPYTPRGCAAQAWSVAEFLRAWARTTPEGESL